MAQGTQTPAEMEEERRATREALDLARRIAQAVYTHRVAPLGDEVQIAYQRAVIEPLGRISPADPAARSRIAAAMRSGQDIVEELERVQLRAQRMTQAERVTRRLVLMGPLLGGISILGEVLGRSVGRRGAEAAAELREYVRQVVPRLQIAAGLGGLALLAALGGGIYLLSRGRAR